LVIVGRVCILRRILPPPQHSFIPPKLLGRIECAFSELFLQLKIIFKLGKIRKIRSELFSARQKSNFRGDKRVLEGEENSSHFASLGFLAHPF
jgi:hypothetical protein